MAAGPIYVGLGHDRITGLRGVARALPLGVLAFAVAGITLVGVQPSGASLAKELLQRAAAGTGQWWWAIALEAGGMFTAAYVVLVLAHALAPSNGPTALRGPTSRLRNTAALVLALFSLLLGLLPWNPYLPIPNISTSGLFETGMLPKTFVTVLGGIVLAVLLTPSSQQLGSSARWKFATKTLDPFRRVCGASGRLVERGNGILCQWPAASICLLALALLFGTLMLMAL